MSERLRSWLMLWRWPLRLMCHGSIHCCQYVDKPNDNNPYYTGNK